MNVNVQAGITQIGNGNVNAQSDIGQSSKTSRRLWINDLSPRNVIAIQSSTTNGGGGGASSAAYNDEI